MSPVPIRVGSSSYTGFDSDPAGPDYGLQIVLKDGDPGESANPSFFYPIALDGGNEGNWYRNNISGCSPSVLEIGEWVRQPMPPAARRVGRDYWAAGSAAAPGMFPVASS